jgi:excisionase family DNA binding protein
MNEQGQINLHESRLLKSGEVSSILKISRSLVYRMMQTGVLPTVRFGSSVRVRERDLVEFIQRGWSGWKTK